MPCVFLFTPFPTKRKISLFIYRERNRVLVCSYRKENERPYACFCSFWSDLIRKPVKHRLVLLEVGDKNNLTDRSTSVLQTLVAFGDERSRTYFIMYMGAVVTKKDSSKNCLSCGRNEWTRTTD